MPVSRNRKKRKTTKNTSSKKMDFDSRFEKLMVEYINKLSSNDILHPDGSKTYCLMNGGSVKIDRPVVVKLIEDIIKKDFRGYSYMSVLDNYFKSGDITESELMQIIKILD